MRSEIKSLISPLAFALCILLAACQSKQSMVTVQQELPTKVIQKYSADQEIEIPVSDTVVISGSLTYVGTEVLSIIIAGSGPTDRDCNSVVGVNTNAFLMLADSLKQAGISSYRYDKRSVGKSTKVKESDIDFNDFVNDASAIVDFFKDDFAHINLIGHSEGALIGTIVSHRNSNVNSFVNLSGTSISLDSIALEQLEKYPNLLDEAKLHFEEIRAGLPLSEVNPLLASLFRPSVVKFFTSIMAYNPSIEHSKITIPVLVIGGTCDIQVTEKHAKKLYASLRPNRQNKFLMIDNMGHVLKTNKPDCSDSMSSYSDPVKPLHPELSKSIAKFINASSTLKIQDP